MRVAVLGTSAFTLACTRALLDAGAQVTALVSLPAQQLPENSADIAAFAAANGIYYIEAADINALASVAQLRSVAPDYLLSSWPHLIGDDVLAVPRHCTIGSHPTELPHNRGRHPLHWLITQGITRSAVTFFRMDEGIDSGPLLFQAPFTIEPHDTVADAAQRMCDAAYAGLREFYPALADGSAREIPQNTTAANTWRKKSIHDVTLDLRLPTLAVVDLVRSFAPPYPGARLLLPGGPVRVHSAVVATQDWPPADVTRMEPGKVLARFGKTLTVKAGDGIVALLLDRDVPAALREYVHPPTYYLER